MRKILIIVPLLLAVATLEPLGLRRIKQIPNFKKLFTLLMCTKSDKLTRRIVIWWHSKLGLGLGIWHASWLFDFWSVLGCKVMNDNLTFFWCIVRKCESCKADIKVVPDASSWSSVIDWLEGGKMDNTDVINSTQSNTMIGGPYLFNLWLNHNFSFNSIITNINYL